MPTDAGRAVSDAIEVWLAQPVSARLDRLGRTPDDVAGLLDGRRAADAARRPGPASFAPVEVVCHLRDIEDIALLRYRMMLQMTDPMVPAAVAPADRAAWGLLEDGASLIDPERWARDRQYLRNDAAEALGAFRDGRAATLAFLAQLSPDQWSRGSIHPVYGRLTYGDWTGLLSWHDDNHVAQLGAAFGEPR